MLSPVFNLLIGRQMAVNDGLSGSQANKLGLVSMMIPNVYGLVITNVLAQKEAAANAAAHAGDGAVAALPPAQAPAAAPNAGAGLPGCPINAPA